MLHHAHGVDHQSGEHDDHKRWPGAGAKKRAGQRAIPPPWVTPDVHAEQILLPAFNQHPKSGQSNGKAQDFLFFLPLKQPFFQCFGKNKITQDCQCFQHRM